MNYILHPFAKTCSPKLVAHHAISHCFSLLNRKGSFKQPSYSLIPESQHVGGNIGMKTNATELEAYYHCYYPTRNRLDQGNKGRNNASSLAAISLSSIVFATFSKVVTSPRRDDSHRLLSIPSRVSVCRMLDGVFLRIFKNKSPPML